MIVLIAMILNEIFHRRIQIGESLRMEFWGTPVFGDREVICAFTVKTETRMRKGMKNWTGQGFQKPRESILGNRVANVSNIADRSIQEQCELMIGFSDMKIIG